MLESKSCPNYFKMNKPGLMIILGRKREEEDRRGLQTSRCRPVSEAALMSFK